MTNNLMDGWPLTGQVFQALRHPAPLRSAPLSPARHKIRAVMKIEILTRQQDYLVSRACVTYSG